MHVTNIEDIYPLSPMQQGMLFHSLYAPETGVYFEQSSWTLRGDLDVPAFGRAWQWILDRHSALRTSFLWEDLDEPLQVVHRQVELPFEWRDWLSLPEHEQESRLEVFLQTDRERGFELSKAPLMRLALMQTAEDTFQFVWSHHHLLLDGWSLPIIFGEVFALYEAFQRGEAPALQPTQPYRAYIAWLQSQDMAEAEVFWRSALAGFTVPTPLAVDSVSPGLGLKEDEEDYALYRIGLSAETTEALRALARQYQLTLNTIVQGAWALLLSRYSGEGDVVFGATVSGRPPELPGADSMVGLFINTLPARARIRPSVPVLTWLKELQDQHAKMRQYEYTPLVEIQGWSDVPREVPLFESLLVFENYPVIDAVRERGADVAIEAKHSFTRTNYPLTVAVSPGRELTIVIAYDHRRFNDRTVTRMGGHLSTLLEGIAADPEQDVATLSLLTGGERREILVEWNATQADFPHDQCVHELFESQVGRTPELTALVFQETALTYRKLNRRANQLAHYLRKLGVGPETPVGIYVGRSPEMVVGMLGILKAGGAYVPLDPKNPRDRLAFMLEDTGVSVLLTQANLADRFDLTTNLRCVCLDTDWETVSQESAENPMSDVTPENLAYVIYTSGSTGRPKGVLLEHRGLCNQVVGWARHFELGPQDRQLQFLSLGFDGSIVEFFPALVTGATLHLIPEALILSMQELHHLLQEREITALTMTPSTLTTLPSENLHSLRTVMSGGELCSREVALRWAEGRRFANVYGPTEATVTAAWHDVRELRDEDASIPIGRPFPNVRLYVLDTELSPVPIGVPGELYIGGVGVARGYLNRPGLTSERFIPDPFSDDSQGRLYRTGDLVRQMPGGDLEFLGRVDRQVKVRGFRIELGEIEAMLNQHPALEAAAVLVQESGPGDKRLVAYFVPGGGRGRAGAEESPPVAHSGRQAASVASELRSFLQERLPDYMVPSAYVAIETLPLTPSGKVDRRALPAPGAGQLALAAYVAPRTPVEEELADIWSQVLKIDRVGVHDDFFELGGHSLLATQLISRAREVFEVDLSLPELFETPTVAGLAQHVESELRAAAGLEMSPIEPASREGNLPLSFAQQRLWFLDQLAPDNLFYNIPLAVRLTGPLDVAALEGTLKEVVRRHEVLRTTFAVVDGKPVQVIAPEPTVYLPKEDLTDMSEAEREAAVRRLALDEAQKPFDLTTGPLLRARLLRLAKGEHVLLLTMHHIVSDGWSMGVFVREVAQIYTAFVAGEPSPLTELPIQYGDFAQWQREWLQGEVLETQLSYWRDQLGGSPPMLELPTDHPRPAVQTSRGATESLAMPRGLSQALKTLGREEGATLFMTLLAAFQTLLYRYTGQRDISVGTPIAGRGRPEVEDLIGFFVNTLVMRTDLSGTPSFRDLLRRVRKTALEAYAHPDLPFETLVEALRPERDLSHTPLFQTMLVLDIPSVEPLQLPGLMLHPIETHSGAATFDFTLSITDLPEGLGGYVEYNADLFEPETIRRMIGHFQTLLEGIVANPDQRIAELPLLTEAERNLMLFEWNATARDFPREQCIHQLIEGHVEAQSDAPALIFDGEALTYRDLDRRANQLAHHLRGRGVGPETLVGVLTARSPEMVVGILGTLKAGGAYLPLDPMYPEERLAFMLEDSQAEVLLTQNHLREHVSRFIPAATQTIYLDAEWDVIAQEPQANPQSDVGPDNLAYVIYTSGSTGRPKGTMLQHRGLCNLTDVQRRAFDIRSRGGSRILQFSPLSFDASVWETFMALRNGATLCLARQETLASGHDLLQLMVDIGVTNATLPPSVLAVLPQEPLPDLETVISAGEACTAELVARWAPGRQFVNAYGPTETTVCASMHVCDENDPKSPPIGQSIENTQLYILDQALQPVPIGVPGELVVGGVSLARGYLGRPKLTAESFIPDPFSGERGARLYRTGDLVCYRPNGDVDFLGRIDHQVKVRGFRIELGEIEAVLGKHPHLQDSVVVVREDVPGDRRIVAYLVPGEAVSSEIEKEADLTPGALRSFLRETLPEYMVPSAFVTLEGLPLSPSGKVDRDALPAPDRSRPELERVYVAPRNETEETLARLCGDLLRVERVGVYDSFFELGGHSLLATQFISRLRDTFQVELPLRTLFEHPTVAELAEAVEEAMRGGAELQAPTIKRASREAYREKRTALDQNGGRSQE
jgi:amino acid adenylation domain-containing protein